MISQCENCRWWFCGPGRSPSTTMRGERRECHVNAPFVMFRGDTETIVTLFPGTQYNESCGQWESNDW
jgi:hypothetical protein